MRATTWNWRTSCCHCHPGMYPVSVRKMYRSDVAELAGIKPTSLGRAKLPPPDGVDIESGHARPWWKPQTARAWLRARPGKGWRRSR